MTKTENLAALPLIRQLTAKEYHLFSCHIMVEDGVFVMSLQVWKPWQGFVSRPRFCSTEDGFMGVVDDSSGFNEYLRSNQI